MNFKQSLADFDAENTGLIALAFADLTAEMVLSSASKRSQKQEFLDALAKLAVRLFGMGGSPPVSEALTGDAPLQECWSAGLEQTGYVRRLAPGSDEALIFILGPDAQPETLIPAARGLADRLADEMGSGPEMS